MVADNLRDRVIAAIEANYDDAAPSLSLVDVADSVLEVVSEFWWERRLNEVFPDEFPPIHRMGER